MNDSDDNITIVKVMAYCMATSGIAGIGALVFATAGIRFFGPYAVTNAAVPVRTASTIHFT